MPIGSSSPPRRVLPPITAWPLFRQHDGKAEIDAILREHDYGSFQRSAGLVDELLTDDRIAAVTDTRIGGLLACPLNFKPSADSDPAREAAQLLGGTDDAQGIWRRLVPPEAMHDLLTWARFLGVAVAQVVWTLEEKVWWPRVVPWHPQFIRWDWQLRRFMATTSDGQFVVLPNVEEQPRSDGEWLVWCPYGVTRGWRRGILRSLAHKYILRQWTERDWARYCEKHGMALVKGRVPGGSKGEERDAFEEDLSEIGNEPVVIAPNGVKGKEDGYDVEFVEATAQTWQSFDAFKKALDTDIAVRVLGNNLTTDNTAGSGGSRALGQVQDLVRQDKLNEDAEIAHVLRAQLLTWWAEKNLGDPELAPIAEFQTTPPNDEEKDGKALTALGQGLQALKLASSRTDVDTMLEAAGVPLLDESEIEEPPAAAPPPGKQGDPNAPDGEEDPAAAPPEKKPQEAAASATHGIVKRYEFQGMPIAVETPAGGTRMWRDEAGKTGSTRMLHDYGYIDGYLSGDGEPLDVYVGPDESAPDVHVVHQLLAPDFKRHDEDKVMLGFPDAGAAKAAYLAHRNDGDRAFGGMSTIPVDRFRARLRRRDPESTTKIRAHAHDHAHDHGHGEGRAKLAQRTIAGRARATKYAQALELKARARGGAAVQPSVQALLAAIKGASDFADAKRRVLATYRDQLSPDALAEVVRRTRLLARLAGHKSAVDEIG